MIPVRLLDLTFLSRPRRHADGNGKSAALADVTVPWTMRVPTVERIE
jgi:hypothetical protein